MEWSRGHAIGRGSSATVSVAKFSDGTVLAVKSAELGQSQILQREHQIVTSLGLLGTLCPCPHIVTYKGCDVTAETNNNNVVMFNLFMEYAPAGTITDAGRLEEPAVGRYTWQILKGLEHLHSLGHAHCDIKGRNILVTETGAKIADFGCAKKVLGPGDNDRDHRPVRGTPGYMGPEAARGEQQGLPGDVWALGCTVVEMATGSAPWTGEADPAAVLYRIGISGESPEIPISLSGDGRDFLEKCFMRDPRDRWTVGELLKHPFVSGFEHSEEKQFGGFDSVSPTSVLDRRFWCSEEEPESPAGLSREILDGSARERIGRLCVIDHDWGFDEDWITVRFGEASIGVWR